MDYCVVDLTSLVHAWQFGVLPSLPVITDHYPVTAFKLKVYQAQVRKDVCVCAYTFVSMHMCVCVCVCACVCVCKCLYVYIYKCACVRVCVCTHIYILIDVAIHRYRNKCVDSSFSIPQGLSNPLRARHLHKDVCMFEYVCMYFCSRVCVCVYVCT